MSFLKGFTSIFDWMLPKTLDERLQDLYDDMEWGEYMNPNEMRDNWIIIDDVKIRNVWQCPDCDRLTTVSPSFYEEAGTPFCPECDCDMVYLSTEVNCG